MLIRSIQWRLQLWYGLLLVAVLAAFGFTICRLEQSARMRQLDEELRRRVAALAMVLSPTHI